MIPAEDLLGILPGIIMYGTAGLVYDPTSNVKKSLRDGAIVKEVIE